jgi:FMNH2-dependent dimethyl sulfone monooxygenase
MRFGYWMPVFGGWLRNVADERMTIAWPYIRSLATDSERQGFDLTLIAELNLNDIKGHHAPALDAWSLTPAVAAVTSTLELMIAVRPNYHSPTATAKALSTLDLVAPGRLSLNVVSSWWKDEAAQYGAPFDVHDARYARTEEWLTVLRRLLTEETVTHHGALYSLEGTVMEPKPPLPTVYMGGESPKAKEIISTLGDAYVMHGDPPDVIAAKVTDLSSRRRPDQPPMRFGVSGYVICRDTESEAQTELDRILDVRSSPEAYASYQDFVEGSHLESEVTLREYSVSNRGLRAGLIGTPKQITERIRDYESAGVDLMLLQFSPQHEEMARFSRDVIAHYPG